LLILQGLLAYSVILVKRILISYLFLVPYLTIFG
jgi:hypothetical protein